MSINNLLVAISLVPVIHKIRDQQIINNCVKTGVASLKFKATCENKQDQGIRMRSNNKNGNNEDVGHFVLNILF